MQKYWTIAKNSFQEYFSYRLNLGLEVAGGLLFILVTLWLWTTIVSDGTRLGGYDQAHLITYLIGTGIITSYFFLTSQGEEISDDIHRGSLSGLLVKPLSPIAYWFVRDQARKLVTALFGCIGIALIAWYYLSFLVLPSDPGIWMLTMVFVMLGGVLHFMVYSTVALVGFWSEQTWGERFFIRVISELASGMMIPLTLLPFFVKQLSLMLPFRFFAYVPMQVFLGRLDRDTLLGELLQLALWILFCTVIMRVLWKRGVRAYAGEGQ